MKWNYNCPRCNNHRVIEWAERQNSYLCHQNKELSYIPPTPAEQHSAYVDTHDWPSEMEQTVKALRGTKCTVPGCNKTGNTLDHRTAFSKGGKTCVANLYPMCTDHNLSKNDSDYDTWLKTL